MSQKWKYPMGGWGSHRCKIPKQLPGAGGGGCPAQVAILLPKQRATLPQDPSIPCSETHPSPLEAWKTTVTMTRILMPAVSHSCVSACQLCGGPCSALQDRVPSPRNSPGAGTTAITASCQTGHQPGKGSQGHPQILNPTLSQAIGSKERPRGQR